MPDVHAPLLLAEHAEVVSLPHGPLFEAIEKVDLVDPDHLDQAITEPVHANLELNNHGIVVIDLVVIARQLKHPAKDAKKGSLRVENHVLFVDHLPCIVLGLKVSNLSEKALGAVVECLELLTLFLGLVLRDDEDVFILFDERIRSQVEGLDFRNRIVKDLCFVQADEVGGKKEATANAIGTRLIRVACGAKGIEASEHAVGESKDGVRLVKLNQSFKGHGAHMSFICAPLLNEGCQMVQAFGKARHIVAGGVFLVLESRCDLCEVSDSQNSFFMRLVFYIFICFPI